MKKITVVSCLLIMFFAFAYKADAKVPFDRQDRYQEVFSRVISKSKLRYDNYGKFIVKLESRRSKLSAQGIDVTEIDNNLRLSKAEYNELRVAIETTENNLESLDLSGKTGPIRQSFSQEIKSLRTSFKELHQQLVTTVRVAKSIQE